MSVLHMFYLKERVAWAFSVSKSALLVIHKDHAAHTHLT